jgi:pimeloyl-ACP methyl ester carboxylesterase
MAVQKLHFIDEGKGTPVVLLHGFPLSGAIWEQQVKRLRENCRVIVPDLRGHGRSPAPEGVYEMEQMAGDVFALLDSLGIQKAAILGHSMGGYAALAAWRTAPQRVLALGLICSQAGADTEEGRQGRYKTAEKVAAEGSKVVADAMSGKLFAPSLAADAPMRAQVRQIMESTVSHGVVGTLKGMAVRPDVLPQLAEIKVPFLIITGDQDQVIPPAKAQAMAAAAPKATLEIIANAGHMPMLEQPEATTQAIEKFVATLG